MLCASGCGNLESTNLLFLSCNVFGSLWHPVHNWLGISSVDSSGIANLSIQFGNSEGYFKSQQSLMYLVWLSCIWIIWKKIKSMIFNNKECSIQQLLDNIKVLSLWYWRQKNKHIAFGYRRWWTNPVFLSRFYMYY